MRENYNKFQRYPEYKKGNKSLYTLANDYQIEKYLIEQYIQKKEKEEADIQKDEKIIKTEHTTIEEFIASMENKLITLEQKLDYIIGILTK